MTRRLVTEASLRRRRHVRPRILARLNERGQRFPRGRALARLVHTIRFGRP